MFPVLKWSGFRSPLCFNFFLFPHTTICLGFATAMPRGWIDSPLYEVKIAYEQFLDQINSDLNHGSLRRSLTHLPLYLIATEWGGFEPWCPLAIAYKAAILPHCHNIKI